MLDNENLIHKHFSGIADPVKQQMRIANGNRKSASVNGWTLPGNWLFQMPNMRNPDRLGPLPVISRPMFDGLTLPGPT